MPFRKRTNSRFRISDTILTRSGNQTYGLAKKYRFLDRNNLGETDILTHIVNIDQAGKWDKLAADLYGNIDLHWVIPMFNHIENPLIGPKNQEVIEYPSPSVVFAEL